MREILSDKGAVRTGRISELSSDINKLGKTVVKKGGDE